MQQRGLPEALRAYLMREGMSQVRLAREAGVSQATVSRAMKQEAIRRTKPGQKLFNYMRQAGMIGRPPPLIEQLVLGAFVEVWDQTEEHASAVAKIIKATEGLRPIKRESA
jgi:transcriptional regulator with XRE-family HTH domain